MEFKKTAGPRTACEQKKLHQHHPGWHHAFWPQPKSCRCPQGPHHSLKLTAKAQGHKPGCTKSPQKETRKYSNHPFSGAFAVSFREGKTTPSCSSTKKNQTADRELKIRLAKIRPKKDPLTINQHVFFSNPLNQTLRRCTKVDSSAIKLWLTSISFKPTQGWWTELQAVSAGEPWPNGIEHGYHNF